VPTTDGVAFRFVFSGSGDLQIFEESSTITLSGENVTYWGQIYPNNYGYETPVSDGESKSNAVKHDMSKWINANVRSNGASDNSTAFLIQAFGSHFITS
jgi:hypothetical protein